MLEEENSRLKRLLIATVVLYSISWIAAYASNKLLYDFKYIGLFIENQWIAYLILFFGLAWMPTTIFLFIQARGGDITVQLHSLSITSVIDVNSLLLSPIFPPMAFFPD